MNLGSLGQIFFAALLMITADVLAFLMVLRILEPTLFLCFTSFFMTLGGLVLGFVGLAEYVRQRRSGR